MNRVLKFAARYQTVGKSEFSAILGKIIEQVHKNTGIGLDVIQQKTHGVLRDMPQEYGQLNEEDRSWEAVIAYLYVKYLQELGVLER